MAQLEDLRINSPVPRPRRSRRSPWPLALAVVGLAGLGLWRFGGPLEQAGARLAPAKQVEIYKVPSGPPQAPGSFTAGGYLEVIPPGPALVSTLLPGKLSELHIKVGDTVHKGDIVARLDASIYQQDVVVQRRNVELAQATLEQQRAGFRSEEVEQARARLSQAEARQAQAQADFSRAELLFGQGVVSRAEYDASRSALDQAAAQVSEAQSALSLLQAGQRPVDLAIYEAQLAAARASLARAQTLVEKSTIKAPITGVVIAQYVQPGSWVSVDASGEHPGVLASIMEPGQIQAWADVNQRDIANVAVGQEVELVTDAFPDRKIAATVSQILPVANLQKNTVQAKIAIPSPPDFLRPEMSVQVTFRAPQAEGEAPAELPAVMVPGSAVVTRNGQSVVYVVSGGVASARTVELGAGSGDQQGILSGIGPGDQVIVDPSGISEGSKVTASTEAASAETEGNDTNGS